MSRPLGSPAGLATSRFGRGVARYAPVVRRFSTFGSIGLVAAVVYAVVLYACVKILGLSVLFGSMIAFACGIPISYIGNRRLTYASRNAVNLELRRFFVAQGVNLLITSTIIAWVSASLALPLYASMFLAYGLAPCVTWILFELWVYKDDGRRSSATMGPTRSIATKDGK